MTAPGGPMSRAVLDGRYELDARLDDWGLGEAWRARDGNFDQRTVVVKLLGPLATDEGEGVVAFTQHARNLRSLRHANVLPVVNHGVWERRPYVVTDLAGGSSLGRGLHDARTAGERLPLPMIEQLFGLMCAGVAAAHEALRPISHGGLNPGSVRIERASGGKFDVRVMDFGLAAMLHGGPAGSPLVRPYASPEVLSGAEATPAGDVRALGMLLVEMLTAGPGQDAEGRAVPVLDVIAKDGQGLPSVVQGLRDDVSPAVWEVIAQAVHHTSAQRFATAGALRDALKKAWATPLARPRAATVSSASIDVRGSKSVVTPAVPSASAPPPLTDAPVQRAAPGSVSVVTPPPVSMTPTMGPSLIAAPPQSSAPLALGMLPSMVSDIGGPTPRRPTLGDVTQAPSDAWELHTDISRPPPSPLAEAGTLELDEPTHFLEAPPATDLESTIRRDNDDVPPPPDDSERTRIHETSDDAYDLRATTPVLHAVPYAIPVAMMAPREAPSDVLRSFDNVVGRMNTDDDWTSSHRAIERPSVVSAPVAYRPPGSPPGVGIPPLAESMSSNTVAVPPPRRSVVPWVIAAVLVIVSLAIAAAALLIQ